MSLTSREGKQLATVANSAESMVRLLQTINANMISLHQVMREATAEFRKLSKELNRDVDLDKLVEDSKKIAEAGKNFEEIRLSSFETSGPDIGFSIPLDGVNWCLNDKVRVTDEEEDNYLRVGHVVNARNWPENFQLAVTFAENQVSYAHFVWLRPDQLTKIVEDANQVELPAVVEKTPYVMDDQGRLFPWQWRHNLGMDKLPENIRQQHQPHENHPMTEEAFRIYNAGLVAVLADKEKREGML